MNNWCNSHIKKIISFSVERQITFKHIKGNIEYSFSSHVFMLELGINTNELLGILFD